MKKIFLIFALMSISNGQNKPIYVQTKVEWFFSDMENKEKIEGENKEQIDLELSSMTSSFNKFFKDVFIHENVSSLAETQFDVNGYLTVLLSMDNPTIIDMQILKNIFSKNVYTDKIVPRVIKINKVIKIEIPKWQEILKYYGSYSKLAEAGIDKSKIKDFELITTLENIKLNKNDNSFVANIKISGTDLAFSYYGIIEKELKLKGDYILPVFTYIDINQLGLEQSYYDRYELKDDVPKVKFIFKDKLAEEQNLGLDLVFGNDLKIIINTAKKINNTMSQMIEDLISNEFFSSLVETKRMLVRDKFLEPFWIKKFNFKKTECDDSDCWKLVEFIGDVGIYVDRDIEIFVILKFNSDNTYRIDFAKKKKKMFGEMKWEVYASYENQWFVPYQISYLRNTEYYKKFKKFSLKYHLRYMNDNRKKNYPKYSRSMEDLEFELKEDYIFYEFEDVMQSFSGHLQTFIIDNCCIEIKNIGTLKKPSVKDLIIVEQIYDNVKK